MPAIIGCCWRRAICRNGCLAVCSGGSLGCRFRRDSRGCGSRKIDPESRGDGGVSDKTGWKGRGQQLRDSCWGTRDLCRVVGPAKENKVKLESPKGYIVSGCWELKRKFRTKRASPAFDRSNSR